MYFRELFLINALLIITVDASFRSRRSSPVYSYCTKISIKQDPLQVKVIGRTIERMSMAGMLAASEVLQLGQNLIRLIQGKRALDIGTFTGSSAVAWAQAIPRDGEVLTIDVTPLYFDSVTRELLEKRADVGRKIRRHIGPALQKLDELLATGEAGTWDFVFIDADKMNYPNYYEKAIELLRPGGVLLIDNALWGGAVAHQSKDIVSAAIDETNQRAANDKRVDNFLLEIGDGTHVIFKKHIRKEHLRHKHRSLHHVNSFSL